jgi:hypothetical protein
VRRDLNPVVERTIFTASVAGLGGFLGAHASFTWAALGAAFGALVAITLYDLLDE